MNIEEAIVRIHRIGKHAAKFHVRDGFLHADKIIRNARQRAIVVLVTRHGKQLARVGQRLIQAFQRQHDTFQGFLLAAEFLSLLRVLPNRRIFSELIYFDKARMFGIEVKDTSATRMCAASNRRVERRGR